MEKKIKVSLICTLKNEGDTIGHLLSSICQQTLLPEEIVIVDGGSTDGTIEIINKFKGNLPIKLIVSPKSNIAKGRNLAISNSSFDLIASTDGGCKLQQDWLENLIRHFNDESEIDVVSGFYVPWYENEFEEIAAYLIFPKIRSIKNDNFLPSSRSVAYKKSAWKDVGGYPEWLETAEDSLFDINLKKANKKFFLEKNAIVYWRVRKDLRSIFKQYYNYSVGDGRAGLYTLLNCSRYVLILILATSIALFPQLLNLLLIGTIFGGIFWTKHLRKIERKSIKRIMIGLQVGAIIETASFIGYLKGTLNRLMNKFLAFFKSA